VTHPRALLRRYGLRPRKRLGQHFLLDRGAAARIAHLAVSAAGEPQPLIVEIGAGTGTLTAALLAAGARVTALEIDADLVALLRDDETLRDARIVHADALAFDYAAVAEGKHWSLAGNLPYNIATPLVMHLVEMEGGPQVMTIMVQRDVADRMTAEPGTAAYGSLSVAIADAMEARRVLTLGPHAFYPRPGVDSAVIQLVRRARPAVEVRDRSVFRRVVRAAFAYRRKTVGNALMLALGLPRERVMQALATSGIEGEIRAERLDLHAFARLADALAPDLV
jgi:16S rRNA (adenine1518-N6/adenine1519-N6)-dimethyltransferase